MRNLQLYLVEAEVSKILPCLPLIIYHTMTYTLIIYMSQKLKEEFFLVRGSQFYVNYFSKPRVENIFLSLNKIVLGFNCLTRSILTS